MKILLATLLLSLAALFGTLLVPDVGEAELLDDMLNARDRTLKLYKNDITPAESDTAGTYTEADFTSYAAKTLTGASWNAASTSGGTTSKTYAQQSWTCGASGNTIYGYFVVRSSTLCWAERFASTRVLVNSDVLNLTPRMELA